MKKTIIENQIVIMSILDNLLDHYTAEIESQVVSNLERSKRLKQIVQKRIIESKKELTDE